MSNSELYDVAIVDDDIMLLKALARSIESLNMRVRTISSPSECLNALNSEQYGLLITDVNMPELNGIELVKEVKQKQPFLPIIIMTGFANIPLAIAAIKAGAKEFVEKPLDEDIFLPLINKTVNRGLLSSNSLEDVITASELEVLKLIVAGKSNKEIAYLLEKSIRSVENHRHRLSRKLKAGSPADLVKIAIKNKLLEV